MQNQIECVCFDLDDTLCDYSTAKKAASCFINEQLAFHNINTRQFWNAYQRAEPRMMKRFLHGDISIAEYRSQRFSVPLLNLGSNDENLAQQLNQIYMKIGNQTPLFEDVLPALARLSQSGYSLAILTNGPKDGQMAKIEYSGLTQWISHIFISQEVGEAKPRKEFYQYALSHLSLQPWQALMVGDSIKDDYQGAIQAGMQACLLDRRSVHISFDGCRMISLGQIADSLLDC